MNRLITIRIPTCRRLDLLRDVVESCFKQNYRPLEILIGDDSGDDRSVEPVRSLRKPEGVTVCHFLHKPPRRQARNVDWLIANSHGDRLLLLNSVAFLGS
jgi:glycosyltransferase involved in cell wall biosynthesis